MLHIDSKFFMGKKFPLVAIFLFLSCAAKPATKRESATAVSKIVLTSIQLPPLKSIPAGETFAFTPVFLPAHADEKKLYWYSQDASIADVDSDGKVTAKTCASFPCATEITAITSDASIKASSKIYVTAGAVLVNQLELPLQIIIAQGDTLKPEALINPTATDKSLEWSSSDASIVEVNADGKLTAKTQGNATVTAKAKDGSGKSATLPVFVSALTFVPLPLPKISSLPNGKFLFPLGLKDESKGEILRNFAVGKTEVTYKFWQTVSAWATASGGCQTVGEVGKGCYQFTATPWKGAEKTDPSIPPYQFSKENVSGSDNQPVTNINWYNALLFANAATEWFNATQNPSPPLSVVYKNATDPIRNCNDKSICENVTPTPNANGFRLPSLEEWELAARWQGTINWGNSFTQENGGQKFYFTTGNSFSGASTYFSHTADTTGEPAKSINHAVAVYGKYAIPGALYLGYVDTDVTQTSPVSSKLPNHLGLYDMSGNAAEWCFTMGKDPNTHSPAPANRFNRGGSFEGNAWGSQVAAITNSSGTSSQTSASSANGGSGLRLFRTEE